MKKTDYRTKLAEERTIMADERTLLAEERTFLAFIRTVIGVVGIFVFLFRIMIPNEFYSNFFIVMLALFGTILVVEQLHRFHIKKMKLKTLEERLEGSL